MAGTFHRIPGSTARKCNVNRSAGKLRRRETRKIRLRESWFVYRKETPSQNCKRKHTFVLFYRLTLTVLPSHLLQRSRQADRAEPEGNNISDPLCLPTLALTHTIRNFLSWSPR